MLVNFLKLNFKDILKDKKKFNLSCPPSQYFDTKAKLQTCSKNINSKNAKPKKNLNSNMIEEDKKTNEIACSDIPGECDFSIGLTCSGKDGSKSCQ